jgi:hypothetical protein
MVIAMAIRMVAIGRILGREISMIRGSLIGIVLMGRSLIGDELTDLIFHTFI